MCGVVAMEARRARPPGGTPQGVPAPARSFDDGTSTGTVPAFVAPFGRAVGAAVPVAAGRLRSGGAQSFGCVAPPGASVNDTSLFPKRFCEFGIAEWEVLANLEPEEIIDIVGGPLTPEEYLSLDNARRIEQGAIHKAVVKDRLARKQADSEAASAPMCLPQSSAPVPAPSFSPWSFHGSSFELPPPAVNIDKQVVRRRPPLKLPVSDPSLEGRVVEKTATDSAPVVDVDAKQLALLHRLWDEFVALGQFSTLWSDRMSSDAYRALSFRVLTADWSRSSSLSEHLGTLARWKVFAGTVSIDYRVPDSMSIRDFISQQTERGASVPRATFNSLRWLEQNLGLRAVTDLPRVRRASDPVASHVPTQATPIPPLVWTALENGCSSTNPLLRGLCVFWSLAVLSVVRPVHLQRTRAISFSGFVRGECFKGKRRVKGSRPPFTWVAPCFGISGVDLGSHLREHLAFAACATESRPFLLPDFEPKGSDWATAERFAAKPMALSKVRRLLNLFVRSVGFDLSTVDAVDGLYSLRRVLPSLADFSDLSASARLDVGGWANKEAESQLAMPNLYSAVRLRNMAKHKAGVVWAASTAIKKAAKRAASDALSWDEVFNFWPSFSGDVPLGFVPPLHTALDQPTEAPLPQSALSHQVSPGVDKLVAALPSFASSSASPSCAVPSQESKIDVSTKVCDSGPGRVVRAKPSANSKKPSRSSSSSPCSSSSSSSSPDEEAEDEDYPRALADIRWCVSAGKNGHLHLEDLRPCGRRLRAPEVGQGLSVALATGAQWSPRCYASLSQQARDWWVASGR